MIYLISDYIRVPERFFEGYGKYCRAAQEFQKTLRQRKKHLDFMPEKRYNKVNVYTHLPIGCQMPHGANVFIYKTNKRQGPGHDRRERGCLLS